jgi:hypothetical protein
MFIVFRCSCGRHLYARKEAKSRTCPCGKRNLLSRVRVLSQAEDAAVAGEMVRRLQMGSRGMTGFKPAHP